MTELQTQQQDISIEVILHFEKNKINFIPRTETVVEKKLSINF
jgi:hypothetical protein